MTIDAPRLETCGKVYIGISSGHHESEAVLYQPSTGLLRQVGRGLPFNQHRIPSFTVIARINTLLRRLAKDSGFESVENLQQATAGCVVSMPGVWRRPDREYASLLLKRATWGELAGQIYDDTLTGLFAETASQRGVCAFAGTGASVSVALGSFVEESVRKYDGWGPIIGDYGSGFQTTVSLFRSYRRLIDKGEKCPLFDELCTIYPNLQSLESVQKWFDDFFLSSESSWTVKFAAIASILVDAEHRDDESGDFARELLKASARELIETINIAYDKVGLSDLPLVLQGGLCRHSSIYRGEIESAMLKRGIVAKLARAKPVYGSLLLALSNNGCKFEEFHESLRQVAT